MSSLLGALAQGLAGAANVVGQQAAGDIQQGRTLDLQQHQSDMEQARQQAILNYQLQLQDQQRAQQVARIQAAKGAIADAAVQAQYGSSAPAAAAVAPPTDALPVSSDPSSAPGTDMTSAGWLATAPPTAGLLSSLTPQASTGTLSPDAAALRAKVLADPDTYQAAATATGDLTPEQVVSNVGRQQIAQLRYDQMTQAAQQKYDTLKAIADERSAGVTERTQALLQMKQMQVDAANLRAASGGAEKTPANVATANWLVQQGIAKGPADAWNMVTSGKAKDPNGLKAQAAIAILNNTRTDSPAYTQALNALTGLVGGSSASPTSGQSSPSLPKGWSVQVGD